MVDKKKTNKLTIHLIKREVPAGEIMQAGAVGVSIDGIGHFYAENSHAKPPGWFSDFFGSAVVSPFTLLTASSKGVLLIDLKMGVEVRTFAIVFGRGRFLLAEGVSEERFGLKIVLNTMVKDSFRSLDRTSLGSVPKQSREQMSKESSAFGFGINIEQDLIKSVTAKSKDKRFGKTISGRDALTASVKFDSSDIRKLLQACMERYNSEDYKIDFEWIDQIKDVRDPTLLGSLSDKLVNQIATEDPKNVWMAAPDILDWVEVKGFRYSRSKKADLHDDLELSELLESLGDEELSLDWLKAQPVIAVSAKDDGVLEQWNAFRCIYAEVNHDGRMFILNNGKWYEIEKNFSDQVMADFNAIPEFAGSLPEYSHNGEGEYNEAAIDILANSCCMDRKMIHHGGGYSSIEFCDLLTADKKLIHVKRYSGSAQLSHLFAQGAVSGELFVQDSQFREKLNEKLPNSHKLLSPEDQPDPKEYEIVFAIIIGTNDLDIPFFSKVSLRNARRRLQGYGYKVSKKRIGIAKAA